MYSTEAERPRMFANDLRRLQDKPFQLIQFAKKALVHANASKRAIQNFSKLAGQEAVVRYHVDQTPQHVIDQVIQAVKLTFELLREKPKEV